MSDIRLIDIPLSDVPLVACDLDRTLIYSSRAFWLTTPDADAPPIVVSEVYQGVPISYMTRAAEQLLRELTTTATFVPVTTRTVAQYSRVRLPGGVPRFAITTNGGTILSHGEVDVSWSESLRARLTDEAAPLPEVRSLLEDPAASGWIQRVHTAEDLFSYAIIDRDAMPSEWIAGLHAQCAALGWTVSVQGRKLYCVPDAVNKSAAVAEVRRRLGSPPVIAAGDSLLDQRMLEEAQVAFRPAHGELDEAGFVGPNLTVTTARGILAGEELLASITRRVLDGFSPERAGASAPCPTRESQAG
ncbi:hydroxymethylpyrimidine pyrophosphatase-like HAD family hydrolase [Glaciihabitans tibetensis]|uniref:Hydroxymethylpyrimidine pyrophosphatase-like HAD family hydrolase n=1 Tax=Glaciihabitans tibetensis TaxID=1266600 RepID=A0A2T0VAF8_9MICO|nr:HAD family hydrolase [Glaciihabitans tibetensis]PRY67143.1 hydroxymethylpyrimidine pyrophosphatase-like HAD family hydrolase [Glaciihabitans tibetensis]